MEREEIVRRVEELIRPLLESRQAELVELSCRQEGSRLALRLLVDTARGITVDELSRLNQAIGALLDEHQVIEERYLLEVNSPGLDRPLRAVRDFERLLGRRIRVTTVAPVQGRREFVGELSAAGEQGIALRLDDGEKVQLSLSDIQHAVQEIKIG